MRLPNNRFSLFLLFLLFIAGVAMIVIPMISQQQVISADDNIYALLAEEIRAQAAETQETEDPPEDSQQEETESEPEATEPPTEEPSETEAITAEDEEPADEFYVVVKNRPRTMKQKSLRNNQRLNQCSLLKPRNRSRKMPRQQHQSLPQNRRMPLLITRIMLPG